MVMRNRVLAVALVVGAVALIAGAMSKSLVQAQTPPLVETSKMVSVVRVDKNGLAYVTLQNPGPSGPTSCFLGLLAFGNVSTEATRALYATFLAAKVNRAPISVEFTNAAGACSVAAVNF
jgi:hypothetical protein